MSYKIVWTKSAETELNEIVDYIIENDGVDIASDIYFKIRERAELLTANPEQGRIVPELANMTVKFREIIFKSWRFIYKVEKSTIKILLIIDERRNIEDILYEKLIKFFGA